MIARKPVQQAICCPCGRAHVVAQGMCATCYSLRRQDARYFGGLREQVLARDAYTCRGCGRPGGHLKRSIGVHHRRPGVSTLRLMLALCPGCHTRIHRTLALRRPMAAPLRRLWRELHPRAHEQMALPFPGADFGGATLPGTRQTGRLPAPGAREIAVFEGFG